MHQIFTRLSKWTKLSNKLKTNVTIVLRQTKTCCLYLLFTARRGRRRRRTFRCSHSQSPLFGQILVISQSSRYSDYCITAVQSLCFHSTCISNTTKTINKLNLQNNHWMDITWKSCHRSHSWQWRVCLAGRSHHYWDQWVAGLRMTDGRRRQHRSYRLSLLFCYRFPRLWRRSYGSGRRCLRFVSICRKQY